MSTALERHVDDQGGGDRPVSLVQVLERMKPEIARALPRHLSADRMLRIALTELRRTPQLGQAPVESLLAALMQAAQLGLEPGPQGHVYLIPKRIGGQPEIVFVTGYKGMIDLAYRSGLVKEIGAVCVWQGEHFVWEEGTAPKIEHHPDPDAEGSESNFRCAYAVAQLTTGGMPHIVIGKRQIARARAASAIGSGRGPWASDWEAMVNKTAIRRLAAFLPMSPEMRTALVLDEQPVRPLIRGEVFDVEEAAARIEPPSEPLQAGEAEAEPQASQPTEQAPAPEPAGEGAQEQRSRRSRRSPRNTPATPEAGSTGQVEDAAPGGRREEPAEDATSEQTSATHDDADLSPAQSPPNSGAGEAVGDPDPKQSPEYREAAAEFQRWVDEETAPKPEQMQLAGTEARLVALRAAVAALREPDRMDLFTQIVDAGRATSFYAVNAELIAVHWPQLEPTPAALLALRDRLVRENNP